MEFGPSDITDQVVADDTEATETAPDNQAFNIVEALSGAETSGDSTEQAVDAAASITGGSPFGPFTPTDASDDGGDDGDTDEQPEVGAVRAVSVAPTLSETEILIAAALGVGALAYLGSGR